MVIFLFKFHAATVMNIFVNYIFDYLNLLYIVNLFGGLFYLFANRLSC